MLETAFGIRWPGRAEMGIAWALSCVHISFESLDTSVSFGVPLEIRRLEWGRRYSQEGNRRGHNKGTEQCGRDRSAMYLLDAFGGHPPAT